MSLAHYAACKSQVCLPYSPPQRWGWLRTMLFEGETGIGRCPLTLVDDCEYSIHLEHCCS